MSLKTNKKRINVSIVLANLSAGGAERVLSFIAQELDKSRFDCSLVILGHEKDAAYEIQGIKTIYFEKPRVLTGIPALFRYLIKSKPDIVISAVAHLNTVNAYLSILFPKIKFIAREVTIASVANSMNNGKRSPFEFLAKKRFNFFDKIICQSEAMLKDIVSNNKVDAYRLIVINNPISDGFIKKTNNSRQGKLKIITVGSFKKIKGHERIINALANLQVPFHYTLVGDGSEKSSILELIEKLGMKDKITHIPFTSDVGSYLANNDVFVQGSFSEGFPNALMESCAVGVPVLAFEAPGGHNEIIIEGVNGHIIASESELTKKLSELNEENYFEVNSVSESVTHRYSKEIIMKKYEDLLEEVIKK